MDKDLKLAAGLAAITAGVGVALGGGGFRRWLLATAIGTALNYGGIKLLGGA